ncbi:MAG: hypothetical protein K6L75_12290 [Cellvibrionaceae bacterium]
MNIIDTNNKLTSIAMLVVGIGFAVVYPVNMLVLEKQGWIWNYPERHMAFEHMLVAIYVTLGCFFILGARRPQEYVPLLNFTIVMSLAHGSVMWYDALHLSGMKEHLGIGGDVIGTFFPVVLLLFHPNRKQWKFYPFKY